MTSSPETAKVKEVAGWATGDRRVEAEGRAQQQPGVDEDDERAVEEVEEEVRADHGDVPPDGPAA